MHSIANGLLERKNCGDENCGLMSSVGSELGLGTFIVLYLWGGFRHLLTDLTVVAMTKLSFYY